MKLFLDETACRQQLRPFSYTRHVADIRIGIFTIREKWQLLTGNSPETNEQLRSSDQLIIPANIIPSQQHYKAILIAAEKGNLNTGNDFRILQYPWQIYQYNDACLREDIEWIRQSKESAHIPPGNQCIQEKDIFIEPGAEINFSILNASTGPIYIGKNASVMEGCMIRGPFALGEGSTLKMGTKIYGATSIGPFCMAGGEIKNSVFFEYSNKAHDGYLGDSVIGAWCNLGAGTSNSNVKNTGGEVKYYLDKSAAALLAGNKAGLLMGDYSRAAINTSFNTGTVAGVCCNIFGEIMTETHIPNFTWGRQRYELDKAIRDIGNWKQMKQQELSEKEINILTELYQSGK